MEKRYEKEIKSLKSQLKAKEKASACGKCRKQDRPDQDLSKSKLPTKRARR